MTIKLISLNLWQGGNLFPAILDFLKSEDADILALQEVYDGKDPALADKYRSMAVLGQLGYPYSDFASAYLDKRSEGLIPQGNAILSKFPIIDRGARFLVEPTQPNYVEIPENFPSLPRVLQSVRLDTPDGEINVFNMHGVWDIDGDNDSEARRSMVDIIIKETSGKSNVIVTGDTNAKSTNPAMQALEASLTNVFGTELPTTFNMRHKTDPGYGTAAVDHLYVSPNIQILSKGCPDADVSDHRPLVATLQL